MRTSCPASDGVPVTESKAGLTYQDALRALSERGVRVPDQMSVVGFDDIPEARFFTPSLTTLWLDFDREGRLAMDRLINMIDGEWPVPDEAPHEPSLVLRESSAAAPR